MLSIALACLGYFNLFDLGLGRAVTQAVAARLGAGAADKVPVIIWTSQFIMLIAGIVGLLAFALATPWATGRFLSIPADIRSDSRVAFYLMAACIPVVVTTAGLKGGLEARQQFHLVNFIRIPSGVLSYVCPMLVSLKWPTLMASVATLMAVRVVSWFVYVGFSIQTFPNLISQAAIRFEEVISLLKFGSWITVSNVLGPLMTYMDRLVLGALLPVSAIAYYALAYDVGSQILVIPGAVVSVLFAAYAAGFTSDSEKTGHLFAQGTRWIYATLFPAVVTTTALAPQVFAIWLGRDVGSQSAGIFVILAAGILGNGITLVPFALIQAGGRADITAKVHLFELPIYAVAFIVLTKTFGILGTAVAWSLRCIFDCGLMFYFATRIMPSVRPTVIQAIVRSLGGLSTLAVMYLLHHWLARTVLLLAAIFFHSLWVWAAVLTGAQRNRITALSRRSITWLGLRLETPGPG